MMHRRAQEGVFRVDLALFTYAVTCLGHNVDDSIYMTSNDKTLLDKIGTREPPTRSQRSMADEARLASALTGVTERLDAHDDAHEADDDGVSLTRSEGTKHGRYY